MVLAATRTWHTLHSDWRAFTSFRSSVAALDCVLQYMWTISRALCLRLHARRRLQRRFTFPAGNA
jgi:hypothetical protein